eukprot:2384891-Karenia_brevis.AAC.1
MEEGLDMTMVSKHKNGKMPQAGAIMAIYTGALWPGDRLDPGDERYGCPFCGEPNYDEIHMFYTCPRQTT